MIHVKNKFCYDLNAIDSKTKYVLAHSFVDERTQNKCVSFLRQIKVICYEQILEIYKKEKVKPYKKRKLITFVCDGFSNYKSAWSKLFYGVTRLVSGVPIGCKKYGLEHNNNPIERYNQDIKDQIKTKRHFGSFEGAEEFLDLRRIIKCFVNPHQQLKGKTPAEAADIDLKLGRNKLLDLIKYRAKMQMTKR